MDAALPIAAYLACHFSEISIWRSMCLDNCGDVAISVHAHDWEQKAASKAGISKGYRSKLFMTEPGDTFIKELCMRELDLGLLAGFYSNLPFFVGGERKYVFSSRMSESCWLATRRRGVMCKNTICKSQWIASRGSMHYWLLGNLNWQDLCMTPEKVR